MIIRIGECPVGVFAFDEKENILNSKKFSKDFREISEKLSQIREGNLTNEHIELIEDLDREPEEIVVGSEKLAGQLESRFESKNFRVEIPNPANAKLRELLRDIAKKSGFEVPNKLFREVNILLTREDLREEASERDKIIIQSIDAIDELDKTMNTLYGRIREWYGIHFPELERHISDQIKYLQLISELGERENFTKENLKKNGISGRNAEKIERDARNSVGAEFDEIDMETIQTSVEKIKGLQEAREEISGYLEGIMEQIAPNLKTLVGSLIGARLISLAGGLDDLAKMPSSTVQVLGAEKALFRSLNKDAKPPKHGVIFQHPEIRGSPEAIRGKIARAMAGKLSIAAKVDAMSGRYVGDELNEELEERISEIKSEM